MKEPAPPCSCWVPLGKGCSLPALQFLPLQTQTTRVPYRDAFNRHTFIRHRKVTMKYPHLPTLCMRMAQFTKANPTLQAKPNLSCPETAGCKVWTGHQMAIPKAGDARHSAPEEPFCGYSEVSPMGACCTCKSRRGRH
jgi:hypothetical protein